MEPVCIFDLSRIGSAQEVKERWCYAAAEQALRRALLDEYLTQEEIAHNCYLGAAAIWLESNASDIKAMIRYAKELLAQSLGCTIEDITDQYWESVHTTVKEFLPYGSVNQTDLTRELLKYAWGDVSELGFSCAPLGNILDPMEVYAILNSSGLILVGSRVHFKIIYGCSDPGAFEPYYTVWDTKDGTTANVTPNDIEVAYSRVFYK